MDVAQFLATKFKVDHLNDMDQEIKFVSEMIPLFKRRKLLGECLPYRFQPRFYCASGATGVVLINEIQYFIQADLNSVCILDTLDFVIVWIGDYSRPQEQIIALETAIQLAGTSQAHQNAGSEVMVTFQGKEPLEFTWAFQDWKRDGDGLLEVLVLPAKAYFEQQFDKKSFALDILLSDYPPSHLDRTRLETYLSDKDFHEVFGMTFEKFQTFPLWKRCEMKKAVGFY